jgi:hypothetical protein
MVNHLHWPQGSVYQAVYTRQCISGSVCLCLCLFLCLSGFRAVCGGLRKEGRYTGFLAELGVIVR